ncbi:DUF1905 domain-containing protein [Actinoplanes sp. LDG1-06]|uniref:DUF1905 domain-containing protein n=1 Tax=Paractinoplanes ovalisporus TaxID=2810368 RepID=A0ABS2AJN6_9ACTN|nr:DUF1905 domain-containing protein [Actinoplanes ovalisporus]MBM2620052.1 DUF1905 domain-containing protein [Actinoplanes ovalisporus]
MIVDFEAELWIWDARKGESWTFVSLPVEESDVIRDLTEGTRRGFGSVRVKVSCGTSHWQTSIFPGGGGGAYVLPIKQAVRRAQGLEPGDVATVSVEVLGL